MNKYYYVYMVTNKYNTALYTGFTSNLRRRMWEHKTKCVKGFTYKYNADKLVWYEFTENLHSAKQREKQIKGGSRLKKNNLINSMNKEWKDLTNEL